MNQSVTINRVRFSLNLLGLGLIVFFLDQLIKALVNAYIPLMEFQQYAYPYGGIAVFRDFLGIEFSINHMKNYGAAWGVFSQYQQGLIILRIALIGGLITYLLAFNRDISWRLPLLLIIAGALGNVVDYFIYGHVVDMFHFILWGYDFPVFNLADSAISIGVSLLFLFSLMRSSHDP